MAIHKAFLGVWPSVTRLIGAGRGGLCCGLRWNSTTSTAASVSPLFQAAVNEASVTSSTSAGKSVTSLGRVKTIPVFGTGDMDGSHRKLNHLARLIKGMTLAQAAIHMEMCPKKPALAIARLMRRAQANLSHNYGQRPSEFTIAQAWVGKGIVTKERDIKGRGRTGVMRHRRSHLKIRVAPLPPAPETTQDALVQRLLSHWYKSGGGTSGKGKCFMPMRENTPMRFVAPVWSRKPWKYVTSPKWTNPDIVRMRTV